MGKEPRKIKEIPQDYVFSHKITDANGKSHDVYVNKSELKSSSNATPLLKNNSTSGKNPENASIITSAAKTILRPPVKKVSKTVVQQPPQNTEDYVYIDSEVQNPNPIPIYEDKRIDRKLQPSINSNIDFYQYPNPNSGYSQPTNKYFDRNTQREIDITKSFNQGGDYLPSYLENAVKVNEGANLGTVKQGNPRVTTDPTQTYILPGNEDDKSGGMKGISGVGTGGYKKGGLVAKLKGKYAVGGTIRGDKNGDGVLDSQEQDALNRSDKTKSNIGSALGGAGTSYYSSQIPDSKSDSVRNGVMGGLSGSGVPILSAIGGVASIGDQIGKPIKQKSESLNSDGTLNNESAARRNAIIGGIASPSKALAIRSSYKGGYTDISGKGYTSFLEKQAQDQIKQVEAANLASQQQQGLVNRDNNDFDGTITTPYDLKNATFDKNKQLVLGDGTIYDPNNPRMYRKGGVVGKMKQMCANGGKIVGKGTGKSDSIDAKVEANSFVVPVENAPIAEEIRKKFLKAPKIKKANLNQDKGEEVKLSNGEHLFTPKEDEKLEAMGIDLDVLAPEANKSNKFDKGGKVGEKVGKATWDGKKWVDDKGNVYSQDYINKQREIENSQKQKDDSRRLVSLKNTYEKIKNQSGRDREITNLKNEIDRLEGKNTNANEVSSSKKSNTSSIRPPSKKSNSSTNTYTPPSTEPKPEDDIIVSKSTAQLKKESEQENIAAENAKKLNDSAYASDYRNNPSAPKPTSTTKKTGLAASLSNIDPTAFVGIGQTALGLNSLRGVNRPVDKPTIDSTYNESVNRAVNDARFGLTPEQQFAANQDIQNSLNDAQAAAVNYSGGNGVQAFNLSRSAINDAWRARLGLKTADTSLRMQKQQYADQQVAGRANLLAANRRQAFNDAMNTFQQKQQAGSELIGAGLANTIGAYRFNQDMKARQNADYERNRWTTDYGNTLPTT